MQIERSENKYNKSISLFSKNIDSAQINTQNTIKKEDWESKPDNINIK